MLWEILHQICYLYTYLLKGDGEWISLFFFWPVANFLGLWFLFIKSEHRPFHWVHWTWACWIVLLHLCRWEQVICFVVSFCSWIPVFTLHCCWSRIFTGQLLCWKHLVYLYDWWLEIISWVYLWVFRAWIVILLQSSDHSRFHYLAEKSQKKILQKTSLTWTSGGRGVGKQMKGPAVFCASRICNPEGDAND